MLMGQLDIAPPIMAGFKLHTESLRLGAATDFGAQGFTHDETGMVLSLCSMIEGSVQALGTAFLVLPGLAMSAAHVVADYQEAGRLEAGPLLLIGAFGEDLRAWAVDRIRMPKEGDVALLEIVPRFDQGEGVHINHVHLSARLPKVGEPVLALGLIASAPDFPFDPAADDALIAVTGVAATGTVLEFYPRRDRNLPGPTLRCNFMAPGGMSGGPVFDKDGYVCGIVSASMEIDGAWESYVSLHWPAIMFETHPSWPEKLYQAATLWPGHVHENWHLGINVDEIAYFED